ncbi:ATP-grasp fold amidoligase family protein [Tenacibaculum retecalamus]|uniref:ATP-grasp fold amidoligase family protein n=1 Tax=Tenacibaculum retecalamus TaxID=3018315 RepID=UPI0023D95E28|nr:ATP-grasp fold amidoligase family protein [Tenacibaculum retecalamus]WBX70090.1 ATP-grasp fold amidoligase family protein [Tenacibaculum retecalamus]
MNRTVLWLLKKMTFLPQKYFLPFSYEYSTRKKLNLNNPVEFNQKIQWYKMYYRSSLLNLLIDKYTVKEYIKNKIGRQYLIKTLKVYTKANQLKLEELPNEFVLKAVHTNRHSIIVKDKKKLNLRKAKTKLRRWLRSNQYYRTGQEWGYKDIQPKIIAEEFIKEKGKEDLTDYKFFCFNGEPKYLEVHIDRGAGEDYKREIYDLSFKRIPVNKGTKSDVFESTIKKPDNFDEMITIASKLSDDFPFVRVDLYSIKGKTLFGELTFYPGDGRSEYYPDKYNKIFGDMFNLPSLNQGNKK